MEMIINTVRMIDNDQAREYTFGDEISLKEKLAIGFLNPDDFKKLNLGSSINLKISSKFGTVILKINENEKVPRGTILIPISIWANQITGVQDNELFFKDFIASVESTKEPVLSFKDLIKEIKGD
ncbi:MAG: molybdopterin dinucleotide binding domain-containing protein [Promethearchaeota archaeon]